MVFCKRQIKFESRQKCSILFFHFFSVLESIIYRIYRRIEENRIGGTTKRKGNFSSAFEKADSQWKYIFESRHSKTNTIFEDGKKIPQKNKKYIISPIFFTFTTKRMALAIGQHRGAS
jgi:hypothetical protein